ncbi:hypothetical protein H1R20_g7074, partial [Candolleomyces eurysporus]
MPRAFKAHIRDYGCAMPLATKDPIVACPLLFAAMAAFRQINFTIPTELGLKLAVSNFYNDTGSYDSERFLEKMLIIIDLVLTHPGATSFTFLILAFFPKLPPRLINIVLHLISTVLILPLFVIVVIFAFAIMAVRSCLGAFDREGASSGEALASNHDDGEAINASSTLPRDRDYGATHGSLSRDFVPADHHRGEESILWFHMRLLYAGLALYFYCLSISLDAYRCGPGSETCTFVKG